MDVSDTITSNLNSLWLLIAAALVLLMTPGLAFFYGGMVRAKSVISMMMMSFGSMALVGVLWVLYGYGLVFGKPLVPGFLGNPSGLFGPAKKGYNNASRTNDRPVTE